MGNLTNLLKTIAQQDTLKRKKIKLELANLQICSGSDMKLKVLLR